ncbi:helix-turn-helix domain-containing protein [Pelagibius sp.]|uniref:helix-turn-helix domain-containing protein n=1 Tax=Pelagibius sp. TaxID=1931238 RepID=UPI003B51342B
MAASACNTDSLPSGNAAQHELTGVQCRAARALLLWSQEDLARRARVSAVTIRTFERGQGSIRPATARLLRLVFETAGVEMVGGGDGAGGDGERGDGKNGGGSGEGAGKGPGVRLARPVPR